MPRMPATIAALQQGSTVQATRLVRFDFASQTKFLHQGFGPLRTADGTVWEGIGRLGQISDIDRAVVPSGGSPTLALSGVDHDLIQATLAASAEVKGRPVRIFEQHFADDLGLLDVPLALYSGLMDRMWIVDQGETATVNVSTVTLLYNRRRPPFGYLNDASQKRLHPGDKGLGDIAGLVQRNRPWPVY